MRKAFTLIEMLIVVAIMATLMTVVFRITSVANDETKRIKTVTTMQKLENCLSGYYAAFGSYPPVAVYGTRDIYQDLDDEGNWNGGSNPGGDISWESVKNACRSQPIDMRYPFPDVSWNGIRWRDDVLPSYVAEIQSRLNSNDYPLYKKSPLVPAFQAGFNIGHPNLFGATERDAVEWDRVKLFRFGLMSFLLPRFLVMMVCDRDYFTFAQWDRNNRMPCDSSSGSRYQSWQDVQNDVQPDSNNPALDQYIRVANIPTQAVCARWMPNLENLCGCGTTPQPVYGVDFKDHTIPGALPDLDEAPPNLELFKVGGEYYLLDGVTVMDGWGSNLYYYSPDGFQSYTLWSAGPDGRTFPPWLDITKFSNKRMGSKTIAEWIADDLVGMKN